MRKIWALAVKDLRLLANDKVGFFFVGVYPLIFVVFFGYVLAGLFRGGDSLQAIPVAVVDEDQSDAARQFFQALSEHTALKLDQVPTRVAGEDLVRRGKRAACVIIPAGFQAARDGLFTGKVMEPEIIVDPSKPMESAMTQGLLQAALFRQLSDIFTDTTAMRAHVRRGREEVQRATDLSAAQRLILDTFLGALDTFFTHFDFGEDSANADTSAPATSAPAAGVAWQPFRVRVSEITRARAGTDNRQHGSFSIVVPQGVVWGVMACAATFAVALVVERTRGTLPRLMVAPVRRWQILAGKGLACFISTVTVMLGMLVLARLVFGVRPDAPGLLAVAVVCIAVAIVGVMMLFSVVGRTEAAVGGMSWAILVIMAMFGGGMIPLSQMGGFLRTLSMISVFRWAIQALDGAIWRAYTPIEMLQPCGVLLAIGIVGFILGASVFRWQQAK